MSDYEVKHERWPVSRLRHYEPNPRQLRDKAAFTALCASITEFGLAQTLCVLDDGRVLGGNQTLDALTQLAKGFDAPLRGGTRHLRWEPPGGTVHVMVVSGASEQQAKALNLALNRHAGEDVEDEVTAILRELAESAPDLLPAIDTDAEIDRLLAATADPPGPAPNARGVPSITLQFTSAGAHTRVKQALAAAQERAGGEGKTPSGDLLDRLLSAREARRKRASPAANGKPAKRARA